MKLKTALVVSLIVNAVVLAAVGYILASDVEIRNDPLVVLYPKQ